MRPPDTGGGSKSRRCSPAGPGLIPWLGDIRTPDPDAGRCHRLRPDRGRPSGFAGRFQVREIAYDPWQATQLATRLQQRGAKPIEFRQMVANFSEPTKELDAMMRAGRIAHDGDPVLAWMLGNVVGHYDAKENVYPRKERPENRSTAPSR
jgi:hypothetical protein